jgi:hypothetical protein
MMLALAHGGKPADDLLLDQKSVVVRGVVTKVEGGTDGAPIRPSYRFETLNGLVLNCRAFLEDPNLAVDDEIEIEYAPHVPNINRPVGGKIAMVLRLHMFFVWFFLAGALSFTIWLAAIWRLRRRMVFGDIAVGSVLESRAIPYIMPTMLRVAYSYRDHTATERTASHWVRARSALGIRIQEHPRKIAVLHERRGRGISRLVMADDFVVEHRARDEHRPIADS